MRAGLSTIQQTLTSEAATVLNHSIAEAGRRNHGQTTPLHVAATLLSAPTGFLRQACIRSHPNSSHPLQCRALELCFSVALERLPTAHNMAAPGTEPPISNALMAALKRAQANQRRGCPEQQQQPLLAVKVELDQLIISILDDPSVSRVMREASFSSPAVKATIEKSPNGSNSQTHPPSPVARGNLSFGAKFGESMLKILPNPRLSSPAAPVASRNVYLNPRLHQVGTGDVSNSKDEEVKKVLEIMVRSKKKNPILVGEAELEVVVKELLRKLENKGLGNDGDFNNVQVISLDGEFLSDKKQIPAKIKELEGMIEGKIAKGGVILDLGDLKWLVEQPVNLGAVQQQQEVVVSSGRAAVVEMAKLLTRFRGAKDNSLWLIGTATCETYLRCQVYHSTMEIDLDLQAVPIASRSPASGMFPRLGGEGILFNPGESLDPSKPIPPPLPALSRRLSENLDLAQNPRESSSLLKAVPPPLPTLNRRLSENLDAAQRINICSQCSENYETELAKLLAAEKSYSEAKQEASKPSLPQWMRNTDVVGDDAKITCQSHGNDLDGLSKQKIQDLQKKWKDACLHLHSNFHRSDLQHRPGLPGLSMTRLFNQTLISHPPLQSKLRSAKPRGETLQLKSNQLTGLNPAEPPGSPVQTELVLGRKGTDGVLENDTDDQAKDFLSCISSEPHMKLLDKFANALDADTYKKLLKGLMEKAWWQAEAASSLASAVTRCRLGNGKCRGGGLRGDIWFLFTGPDRVGKKKMVSELADQISGTSPIMISLGRRRDDVELDMSFRGKTAIDRIAEAVRRNSVSVIMLEDIDEADMLVRGSIKRAIERGRLADSHGREVSLGNAIFVLTGDGSITDPESLQNSYFVDEKKLASAASGNWQLGLILRDKSSKRRPNWLISDDRLLKPRKEMGSVLSLDLNLAATVDQEDDKTDGSHNSSDITVNHEDEPTPMNKHAPISSVLQELANNVDESIVFKPVNRAFVHEEIKNTICVKFSMVVDNKLSLEVEDDVLEKILGGVWHDQTSLQAWVENVLAPSFEQLKPQLPSGDGSSYITRLVIESDSRHRDKSKPNGDWLPSTIIV